MLPGIFVNLNPLKRSSDERSFNMSITPFVRPLTDSGDTVDDDSVENDADVDAATAVLYLLVETCEAQSKARASITRSRDDSSQA